jgi:hypothetical protein
VIWHTSETGFRSNGGFRHEFDRETNMSEDNHKTANSNPPSTDVPVTAGNGGNGGGGGCIFVAIGPVEHSHTFHSVGGRIPIPISFQFEMGEPEYGSDAGGGTVSVKIGNVEYSHRFKSGDHLHLEFTLKQGHAKA